MSESPILWIPGVAFLLGLSGGVHCAAMCGGIAGALGQARANAGSTKRRALESACLLSTGRITSYTVAGGLVGTLGFQLTSWGGDAVGPALRIALGVAIALTGLVLIGFRRATVPIERLGSIAWSRLSRLAPQGLWRAELEGTETGTKRARRNERWRLFATGALWGWIPCGLVYAALTASLATSSPLYGSLFMFAFGLGTLPTLLAAGTLAGRLASWLQQEELRRATGILVVCYGVWTMAGAVGLAHPAHHHTAMTHDAGWHSEP